jgi:hypothetical protein
VVIDAEFNRDDYRSILIISIKKKLERLYVRIDFQIKLDGPVGLMVKKKDNCGYLSFSTI